MNADRINEIIEFLNAGGQSDAATLIETYVKPWLTKDGVLIEPGGTAWSARWIKHSRHMGNKDKPHASSTEYDGIYIAASHGDYYDPHYCDVNELYSSEQAALDAVTPSLTSQRMKA